jgi:regulator of sigma E protease
MTLLGVSHAEFGVSPKIPPVVARTVRDMPARDIGIEEGAIIVAVNGELLDNLDDVQKKITFSTQEAPEGSSEEYVGKPLELSWKNPDEEEIRSATITPDVIMTGHIASQISLQHAEQFPLGRVGIAFAETRKPVGLLGSLEDAWKETVHAFDQTIFVLKGLFTGQVHPKLLGGPVAIFGMSAQIGREGLHKLLWFCAFLQVNLALLNLLPIPILDGGHIVISLCEGISRRTLTLRQREFVSYIGAALLLPLFVFVFYNDFARIGVFEKIKEILF